MLRKYVRQLRPLQEKYVAPIDKVQSFLTEADTGKATKSEQAIVVAYNMKKGMSEEEAYKTGEIPDAEWKKVNASLKKDGKAIVDSMPDVGDYLVHYGRGSADNYFGKNYKLPAKDTTPKTDLYSNTGRAFSLKKADGAVLLSPKGGEATGVIKASIENFQKNEGGKVSAGMDEVVDFLKNDLDNLALKGRFVEVEKSKIEFTDWYVNKSDRKTELRKKSNKSSDKEIELHMKAELSFYKIPRQSKNYKKNLINNSLMLTKSELEGKYFPAFVQSEFDISGARIKPKYIKTQDDEEFYNDNTKLKAQAIKLLEIGIKQSQFHKKFASTFEESGELKKYIIYEAASGHYKFTGTTGTSYTGNNLAVAKELMEFEVSGDRGATKIYTNMFSWCTKNQDLVDKFDLSFKASGKSAYTKFAIPSKKEKLLPQLEMVINDEYENIQEELNQLMSEKMYLQEGVLDVLKRGFSSAKDAIQNIKNKIVNLIQRFLKTVIFKFTEMIRRLLKNNFNIGLKALGLELQANVSFK
tara:strand:+ start:168 stop:1742 length:1575 start_codon:yes stop_codon:yes gene_type:complete